jgi:hypothetical protein
VVGALFLDLEMRQEAWQRTRGSIVVPVVGAPPAVEWRVPDVPIDRLLESFRLGYEALRDLWAWVVPPRSILRFRRMAAEPADRFVFDDDLWVQTVYDFAVAHRQVAMPRDHLLGSMTPLYLGWLASYAREVRSLTAGEADARLERLAQVFETQKPYLISRWRWPERFRV